MKLLSLGLGYRDFRGNFPGRAVEKVEQRELNKKYSDLFDKNRYQNRKEINLDVGARDVWGAVGRVAGFLLESPGRTLKTVALVAVLKFLSTGCTPTVDPFKDVKSLINEKFPDPTSIPYGTKVECDLPSAVGLNVNSADTSVIKVKEDPANVFTMTGNGIGDTYITFSLDGESAVISTRPVSGTTREETRVNHFNISPELGNALQSLQDMRVGDSITTFIPRAFLTSGDSTAFPEVTSSDNTEVEVTNLGNGNYLFVGEAVTDANGVTINIKYEVGTKAVVIEKDSQGRALVKANFSKNDTTIVRKGVKVVELTKEQAALQQAREEVDAYLPEFVPGGSIDRNTMNLTSDVSQNPNLLPNNIVVNDEANSRESVRFFYQADGDNLDLMTVAEQYKLFDYIDDLVFGYYKTKVIGEKLGVDDYTRAYADGILDYHKDWLDRYGIRIAMREMTFREALIINLAKEIENNRPNNKVINR